MSPSLINVIVYLSESDDFCMHVLWNLLYLRRKGSQQDQSIQDHNLQPLVQKKARTEVTHARTECVDEASSLDKTQDVI